MAINVSALNSTLQTKIDALDAATDTKEVLLLSKALDAAAGSTSVSDVLAEGVVQVNNVNAKGAEKVAEVNALATSTFKTVGGESVLGTGDITTGATVAIRKVHNTSNRVSISGTSGTAIPGLEITMPAASANGVWYEINGWSKFDDDNSSTNGGGIAIWAEINGSSYWVHKQGSHAEYDSGSSDTYRILRTQYLTNGTDWNGFTSGINAGDVIKFRLYAQTHNGSDFWNTDNVSEDWGANGYLQVREISGEVF